MEGITLDVEMLHLGIADADSFFVGSGIEGALDFEAGSGRCRRDQLDDGDPVGERPVRASFA